MSYTVCLAGNPNVGKSSIFNLLTNMNQHTGNWTGKTVENAFAKFTFKDADFTLIDLPGTYSLMSNSKEEQLARNYICFNNPDLTVVVIDATSIERNLNLLYQIMEITDKILVCVNLIDEAKNKGIIIDLDMLSKELGVPVVSSIAKKKKNLKDLQNTIYDICVNDKKYTPKQITYTKILEDELIKLTNFFIEKYDFSDKFSRWIGLKLLDNNLEIFNDIETNLNIPISDDIELSYLLEDIKNIFTQNDISDDTLKDLLVSEIISNAQEVSKKAVNYNRKNYSNKDGKLDKILTSKRFGIPIMLLFLGLIFWITIIGANYPSQFLFNVFGKIQEKALIGATLLHIPNWLSDMLILGVYQTLTWVISVMLPPMAIFFPLFAILEDFGYLPRMAFNMDGLFKKCCCSRQAND